MEASFEEVRIRAIAAALPRTSLNLTDLAKDFGALEVKRIIRSTGIESVRIAGELNTGDLCQAAARSLFDTTGVHPGSVDAIVVVTQTPDLVMPATSVMLQHRLGLPVHCAAFDINYGCSGYIYGLYQAAMLVSSGGCGRVLLCTGDVITKLLHSEDRHLRMLFGDAATATLVERGDDRIDFSLRTDGSGAKHLNTPHSHAAGQSGTAQVSRLYMDGAQVMNFALSSVPPAIDALLDRLRIRSQDVPLYALHQANRFMLEYLARKMGLSPQQVPVQVREVGNTGPSSIPLAMSIGVPGVLFRQDGVVACGFGVGLSIGVAQLPLACTQIIPPVDVAPHCATSLLSIPKEEQDHELEGDLV
ncbi:MAG TPA: ketoacyl-ACP synthase III [Burkholderiaceae bacterium]|nr:ketoacyl-ACP synthase III [Burkholderiaceae bacterium]